MICLLSRFIPSPSMCRSFSKQQLQISRHLSLFNRKPKGVILTDKEKHKIIYYFKYIRVHASLAKLKFIVPAVTISVLPFITIAEIESEIIIAFGLIGLVQYLIINFLLKYNKGIIGFIFVNNTGDVGEIIISSLNEKGERIDRRHKPEDLIVCGFKNKISQMLNFATIQDKQSGVLYNINIQHMKLIDQETFLSVFGNPKTW